MSVRVLIVEQTDTLRDAFVEMLNAAGMDAFGAQSFPEAGVLFAKRGADVVVVELLMMSGSASMLIGGILGALPNARIIATTANGAMRQASAAVQDGAFDYLVKPIDPKRLLIAVHNAVAANDESSLSDDPYIHALFGDALPDIVRMVPSSAPFLIEGEVGTRKQECAAIMHKVSHRAALPFVVRNCERFSGMRLEDLFLAALLKQGGTLYLAEPNHLSLRIQT